MSYSFYEVCNFKTGEQYWENSQYGDIRFTVKYDPEVYNDGDFKQVTFVGVTAEGEEIDYLITKGLEHYGPSISDQKLYYTLEELQECIQ